MAPKNVARQAPPRKSPRVVGSFPSKLLHDCKNCGRPVFWCQFGPAVVPVEVLERPTGDIAIQSQLGSDELTAVEIRSPRTWYRLHRPRCKTPQFSRAPGMGKVRS
jgi:hypothetical protein